PAAFRTFFLINLCEHFAADIFALRFFAAHQAFRRRYDIDAVSAEDLRDLAGADIYAAARTRNACEMRDRRSTFRIIAKEHSDHIFYAFANRRKAVDIAFFLKNTGDFELQLRTGNIYTRMIRGYSVANSCKHVGYWICHYYFTPYNYLGNAGVRPQNIP